EVDVHVVLEVLAHSGQVMDDRDAERLQLVGRADARQQQQARRVHRAAAQDQLTVDPDALGFAVEGVFQAHGAPSSCAPRTKALLSGLCWTCSLTFTAPVLPW